MAEMERDRKKRDRQRLAELRARISELRKARTQKLRGIGTQCRAVRKRITERAKLARVRLRLSIERTRQKARELCIAQRASANDDALAALDGALQAFEAERAEQAQLAAWERSKGKGKGKRGAAAGRGRSSSSARERRQESDDEVAANIEDPGLLVVWRKVAPKIKAGPRRSRTEAFLEWAAENRADVYAIQEADAAAELERLEREQYELQRALRKRGPYRSPYREELDPAQQYADAVPF